MNYKLYVKNEEISVAFDSMSKEETKVFFDDINRMYDETIEEMIDTNHFISEIVINFRSSENYFRATITCDFTLGKEPKIFFDYFKKLSLDEYLDFMNEDKIILPNKWFKKTFANEI